MNAPASIAITPVLVADLHVEGERMPAISDPYGSLVADEVHEQQVRRAVQLRVHEFTEAEHLDLGQPAELRGS